MQIDTAKGVGSLQSWMTLPWGGPEWVVLPGFHTPAEDGVRKPPTECNDLFLAVCGLMSTGVRTILISRWRTAGQTSLDLVREFVQELPHRAPAESWQRAVQLLITQPLDTEAEPRLKRDTSGADPPLADHPFFWAGYMLVDSGQLVEGQSPPPPPAVNVKPKEAPAAAGEVKAGKAPMAGPPPGAFPGAAGAGPPPAAGAGVPGAAPGVPGGPPMAGAAPDAAAGESQAPAPGKTGSKKPTRSQRKAAKAAQENMGN
jgi:hypothetical protein